MEHLHQSYKLFHERTRAELVESQQRKLSPFISTINTLSLFVVTKYLREQPSLFHRKVTTTNLSVQSYKFPQEKATNSKW